MFIAEISDLENEANKLYHNHYFPLCLSDRALLNVEAGIDNFSVNFTSIIRPETNLHLSQHSQTSDDFEKHVSTVEPSSTALGYHKYYLELTNFKLFPLKSIFFTNSPFSLNKISHVPQKVYYCRRYGVIGPQNENTSTVTPTLEICVNQN